MSTSRREIRRKHIRLPNTKFSLTNSLSINRNVTTPSINSNILSNGFNYAAIALNNNPLKMKLLTQNLIKCQAGDCATAEITSESSPYPLKVVVETCEEEKIGEDFYSFNAKVRMIGSMDWNAFVQTLQTIQFTEQTDGFGLEDVEKIASRTEGWDKDEEFVDRVFKVAMGKEILTGELECRRCARKYRIVNGIVNLLLKEDEIEDGEERKDEH